VKRLAAVLLLVTAAGCGNYHLVRAGRVQANVADEVKRELTALRGLDFLEPVPVVAVGESQARTMLDQEVERQFEPGELARISRAYQGLGLLPKGEDLGDAFVALYGRQVAGFYDPITRRMVLVRDALEGGFLTNLVQGVLRRDLTGELVLAHELTHALQDQHFGIDTGRGDLGEDDAQLARRAVYEGDATLAGFGVVLGKLRRSTAVSLAGKLEKIPGELARMYPDIPALVRETVIFQYVAGTNFVSWAYTQAGWEGVNALLSMPPRSTEQVLHPEKYFTHPEYPLAVHLGALAPYLKSDWQVAEDTTLGELIIRILGEQFFAREHAAAIAAGWDGDRMTALIRGDDLALVWLTAWDSDAEAREFFAAYAEILARKHGEAVAVAPTHGATDVVASAHAPYYLERRGAKVLAIEGPLDDDLADLGERIWRRSRYDAVVPWAPLDLAADHGGLSAAPGHGS
jgi:hypothetical protein